MPTAIWKMLIPESLYFWTDGRNSSGLAYHLSCIPKLRVSGDSMSITVARFTRSIALAEYSWSIQENSRYRPLLMKGNARAAAPMKFRRVVIVGLVDGSLSGGLRRYLGNVAWNHHVSTLYRDPAVGDHHVYVREVPHVAVRRTAHHEHVRQLPRLQGTEPVGQIEER